MKLSDKKVYPVSYKFEMFLIDNNILRMTQDDEDGLTSGNEAEWLANEAPGPMDVILVSTAKTMLETLGEYEHGTAEIDTLFDEVASNIIVPGTLARSMSGWSKMEEGVTEEQEQWSINMEKVMLLNLCTIYSDLLLMMMMETWPHRQKKT